MISLQDALVVVVVAAILYCFARLTIVAYFAAKRRHVKYVLRNLKGDDKWSQELDAS